MSDMYTNFDDVSEARRRIMRSIKGKDTKPERTLRSHLQKRGYRFRKNVTSLPGKPDIVFPSRKKVIFVHGCFWHAHTVCNPNMRIPRTRTQFWTNKFAKTVTRDTENARRLDSLGWDVLTVWECEFEQFDKLMDKIIVFLNSSKA